MLIFKRTQSQAIIPSRFYRDGYWYAGLLFVVVFWVVYDWVYAPLGLKSPLEPLDVFILSVLFYPILEEVVFRGFLQGSLVSWKVLKGSFLRLSLANIITSCIFSSMHLINHEPLWAFLVFFPSLVFGYFKDRYQAILPCIILHQFYNLVFLSLVFESAII